MNRYLLWHLHANCDCPQQEYGTQKSCAISTARKLAAFLGDDIVQEMGLVCNYVVANVGSSPFRLLPALTLPAEAIGHAHDGACDPNYDFLGRRVSEETVPQAVAEITAHGRQ